ncbi:MAG: RdgB/HAM1 family non-canonical purine NTP pyrophosphatase [Planctomycetia bacterium]|nr:RdgB/HAM1 family non-canonical purine NTP pyrophosphatase [Planctomycetia bacterium]
MTQLVIGTRNKKKILEIKPLLADLPLELVPVADLNNVPEIAEEGRTFLANASLKARGVATAAHAWTLAEDSGLVVPALNNEPGVDSAIYAGVHGDDAANNAKLLSKIAAIPESERQAYYICVAVLCDPQGEIRAVTEARCHGVIVESASGSQGFGYDPLFLIPEYHKTFGELAPIVKSALSHRAKAMNSMRSAIIQHLCR